jgi:CSLREA domain-containing protein
MSLRRALFGVLLSLCLAAPAQAATFTVDTIGDGNDATPGNGVCETGGGKCSLRAAVQEADVSDSPDVVQIPAGGYGLHSTLDVISNDLTIRGAGARTTTLRQSDSGYGIISISDSTVDIQDLGLTGGTPAGSGGAVAIQGGGDVSLDRVSVFDNHAATNGIGAGGGGVDMSGSGSLTISNSTLRDNSATTTYSSPLYSSFGGGVNSNSGELEIVNSTIANNLAIGTGGSSAYGGGVHVGGGTATITSSTLYGNAASGPGAEGGSIAMIFNGALTVKNSIAVNGDATSAGPDCSIGSSSTFATQGHNIESATSCGFDRANTNPLLGFPGDNGGPTDTFLPSAGSPAIDAAADCPGPADDQRGAARPAGGACDIGSVERAADAGGGSPDAGGGSGASVTTRDTVAPVVSALRLSSRIFRVRRPRPRAHRAARGTQIVFHVSEPSRVTFAFERSAAGRRRSGRCEMPARRNRGGRRCQRWIDAGLFVRQVPEGSQAIRFDGKVRLRGRLVALAPSSYRVRLEARDSAGNRSRPAYATARVIR